MKFNQHEIRAQSTKTAHMNAENDITKTENSTKTFKQQKLQWFPVRLSVLHVSVFLSFTNHIDFDSLKQFLSTFEESEYHVLPRFTVVIQIFNACSLFTFLNAKSFGFSLTYDFYGIFLEQTVFVRAFVMDKNFLHKPMLFETTFFRKKTYKNSKNFPFSAQDTIGKTKFLFILLIYLLPSKNIDICHVCCDFSLWIYLHNWLKSILNQL